MKHTLILILGALGGMLSAETILACELNGRFREAVYSALGPRRAEAQTSFAFQVLDRQTGEILCEESIQPDQNVYPASSIKTLIVFSVLRQVDAGKIGLDDPVEISQSNADAECSAWGCATYGRGKTVSVRKLLWDTITISNNIATNQLIDLISREYANQVALLVGAPGLRVIRKVYDSVNPEPWITERNRGNAAGLASLYREISTGARAILREESRAHLIELLRNQKINGSLNALFPAHVKFYHKTGNTSDSTSDGGFYYLDDQRVAVLVGLQAFNKYKDCPGDDRACVNRTGFESLKRIGKAALDLL